MNGIFDDWRDDMYALARVDSWHKECARICQEREPAFLAIREKLTEQEREDLDLYIAACEELSFSFIYSAYEVGKHS